MKIDYNIPENLNSYTQVVTDIAMIAESLIEKRGYYDYDSQGLSMAIADWAKDFEEAWQTLGLNDDYSVDYFEMIDAYANRKLESFFENVPCMKHEEKPEIKNGVWLRVGMKLDLPEEQERLVMSGCGVSKTIIRQAIMEGNYKLDGETYIPASVVEEWLDRTDASYPYSNAEEVVYTF